MGIYLALVILALTPTALFITALLWLFQRSDPKRNAVKSDKPYY